MAKRRIKQVISVIVAIALIVGVFALVVSIVNPNKGKTVSSTIFSIGGLNEKGEYKKTDDSLYSDWLQCKGLVVEPDFETQVQYQVYYYNYDKQYIAKTDKLKLETHTKGTDYEYAKYCRIVIYPNMGNQNSEDFKIYFWEILGYADDIKITVSNNQNFVVENLYENATPYDEDIYTAKADAWKDATITSLRLDSTVYNSDFIAEDIVTQLADSEEYNVLRINVEKVKSLSIEFYSEDKDIYYYGFNDTITGAYNIDNGVGFKNKTTIIKIDEDTDYLAFNVPKDIENIKINVYLPR